jgi:DNA-directed RNA polymerase III subunit RPC7
MPRGGRYGGGGKKGPEAPEVEDDGPVSITASKPAPTFPELKLPVPKPLVESELDAVSKFLSFRNRARNGPFYAVLDPSEQTDETGKVAPRAGFDPFNDQDVYSSRFQKKRRTVPDVTSQSFALHLFPKELWSVLDPRRKNIAWSSIDPNEVGAPKTRKRKRRASITVDGQPENAEQAAVNESDEDSDAIQSGRKKHDAEKSRRGERDAKQRRGLDAEDDYPEGDKDGDEDGEGDEEPQDSEFDESEDDDNDYNAENYFDAGDDDDMGGDDDDGGGGGGGNYY